LRVRALKPRPKSFDDRCGLVYGLFLATQPTGVKTWAFRYRSGNRTRKLTLSPRWPALTCDGARKAAQLAAAAIAQGRDPAGEKIERRRAVKIEAAPVRDQVERVLALYSKHHDREFARPHHRRLGLDRGAAMSR
jgi:hypothetical protein